MLVVVELLVVDVVVVVVVLEWWTWSGGRGLGGGVVDVDMAVGAPSFITQHQRIKACSLFFLGNNRNRPP